MRLIRRAMVVGAVAASMSAGGVIGASLISTGSAAAQSPTVPAVSSTAPSAITSPGATAALRSNENATHEKQETAAEEKAEATGQGHCVHHDQQSSSRT